MQILKAKLNFYLKLLVWHNLYYYAEVFFFFLCVCVFTQTLNHMQDVISFFKYRWIHDLSKGISKEWNAKASSRIWTQITKPLHRKHCTSMSIYASPIITKQSLLVLIFCMNIKRPSSFKTENVKLTSGFTGGHQFDNFWLNRVWDRNFDMKYKSVFDLINSETDSQINIFFYMFSYMLDVINEMEGANPCPSKTKKPPAICK